MPLSVDFYFVVVFVFFFPFVVDDHFMYVIHIMPQFTVYRLFVFDHFGVEAEKRNLQSVVS